MSPPSISVVIPLYNKADYVRRSLDSALGQTVAPNEIIVVDDGSTDAGPDIARALEPDRIRVISQRNSGVSAARNRGIAAATSDFVAFLDADDEYMPWFLEEILQLITAHPNCGAYATAYVGIKEDGGTWTPQHPRIPTDPWRGVLSNYFYCSACDAPPVWSSAIAVRRDTLAAIGGFPVGERMGEDLDTWARIAFSRPIAYSTRRCSRYRMDAANRACKSSRPQERFQLVHTISEAIKDPSRTKAERRDLEEYLHIRIIHIALFLINAGSCRAARMNLRYTGIRHRRGRWLAIYLLSFAPAFMVHLARRLKRAYAAQE